MKKITILEYNQLEKIIEKYKTNNTALKKISHYIHKMYYMSVSPFTTECISKTPFTLLAKINSNKIKKTRSEFYRGKLFS